MLDDFYIVVIVEEISEFGCLGAVIGGIIGIVLFITGLAMDFAAFVFPSMGTVYQENLPVLILIMAVIWAPAILLAIFGRKGAREYALIICACPIVLLAIAGSITNHTGIIDTILLVIAAFFSAWLPSGIARGIIRYRTNN